MEAEIASNAHAAEAREGGDQASLNGLAGVGALPQTRRASLAVAVLVSLALWAAIWAAVASLAAAMLG